MRKKKNAHRRVCHRTPPRETYGYPHTRAHLPFVTLSTALIPLSYTPPPPHMHPRQTKAKALPATTDPFLARGHVQTHQHQRQDEKDQRTRRREVGKKEGRNKKRMSCQNLRREGARALNQKETDGNEGERNSEGRQKKEKEELRKHKQSWAHR